MSLLQKFTTKGSKYQLLKRILNFELKIGDKSCNFIALCRFPSQSQDDFETFSDNFKMTLEKASFLTAITDDFIARSCNWYSHDKRSFEGSTIESITSQCGLHQLINEPTHLLKNSSWCIDLIFTWQPKVSPIPSSKLSSSNYICWI